MTTAARGTKRGSTKRTATRKPAKRPSKAAPFGPSSMQPAKRTPARRAPAKRTPEKRTPGKRTPKRVAFDLARDPDLEAAVISAPLDPVPRMVYADWIQQAGDPRGEWMAMAAAIERDPSNVVLRSLAVEFLGDHDDLLLGHGRRFLPGGWIGWRGGFVDELRLQPLRNMRDPAGALASLLAHPSSRFVRTIALGDFPRLQDMIDVVTRAAPPLLDTVVVIDDVGGSRTVDIDALVALPTVRRLGIGSVGIAGTLPDLEELAFRFAGGESCAQWLVRGDAPNIRSLTIECAGFWKDDAIEAVLRALPRLPRLSRLRLLHLREPDRMVEHLHAITGRLELLDLSYSRLSDAGVERLEGSDLHVIARATQLSAAGAERLGRRVASVSWSQGRGAMSFDSGEHGWLDHVLAREGRDGLALIPGIGREVFNIGTRLSIGGDAKRAVPLLDASLTFPNAQVKTWAWANAAIAHERLLELDDAELIAREGLLRTPKEPNLYAIIVDALRRMRRYDRARAVLPKALASITARKGSGAHVGGPVACLADCLLTLEQLGEHGEVLAVAKRHAAVVAQRSQIHAILAMAHAALGDVEAARAALARAKSKEVPGLGAHARTVVALAGTRPDRRRALTHLATAKREGYPEWHWIPHDPNLAKLADVPEFQALIAT